MLLSGQIENRGTCKRLLEVAVRPATDRPAAMELRPRHLIGELDSHLDVRLAGAPQSGLQEFGQGVVQVL